MNKKGQSLITFVLLLPILVLFMSYVVTTGIKTLQKTKIIGIIKNNMEVALESDNYDLAKLKKVIASNDKDYKVDTNLQDDILKVTLKYQDLKYCYMANIYDKKIEKCG